LGAKFEAGSTNAQFALMEPAENAPKSVYSIAKVQRFLYLTQGFSLAVAYGKLP
jgi:hypothetical protein